MSIVYVHGVATRLGDESYQSHWEGIRELLARYVAPVISASCPISTAYWGDLGANFAWHGASRPRSMLLGQGAAGPAGGAAQATAMASLDPARLPAAAFAPVPVLAAAGPSRRAPATIRVNDLPQRDLNDLLSTAISAEAQGAQRARMAIAADEVVHDAATPARLAAQGSADEQLDELLRLVRERAQPALAGQGAGGIWGTLRERLGESISRVAGAPGFAVSTVLGEIRRPVNDLATLFVGDVFAYLSRRGDATNPGPIPKLVIETLRAAKAAAPDEPLIVLTHSMGGQIVYDLVSYFIPSCAPELRVDFWCATASQVGLFEEVKLFLASDPTYSASAGNKAPFPTPHLGGWWNVWDHNDFISYTAAPIFERVDDEAYNSGVSIATAHGEYLARPSFYRRFAEKLERARETNWGR
jgi:hypothetical protein